MGMDKLPWTTKLTAKCRIETSGYQASYPSFPIVSRDTIIKSNSIVSHGCTFIYHRFRIMYAREGIV